MLGTTLTFAILVELAVMFGFFVRCYGCLWVCCALLDLFDLVVGFVVVLTVCLFTLGFVLRLV